MNREQWLKTLADTAVPQISSSLELATEELSLKLSCGFPAQKGKRNKISASLVPPTASDEFNAEIFVTPELSENYRDAVRRLNLNGSELPAWAKSIADAMPAYPHASITLEEQAKQSTRLIKVACPSLEHEAYIARLSRKALEFGAPICPCGLTTRVSL